MDTCLSTSSQTLLLKVSFSNNLLVHSTANVALREATAIKGWKGYTGFCVLLFFASILALVTIPILSIPAWSVVYWHRTRWHNAVRAAAKSASRQLRDSGVLGVELRLLCEHWGDGRLAFVLAPAVP